MTEYEKLKEICDKIGYEYYLYDKYAWNGWLQEFYPGYNSEVSRDEYEGERIDVREIIFSQEFTERYVSYCENNGIIAPGRYKEFLIDLYKNVDNPDDYLYKSIK